MMHADAILWVEVIGWIASLLTIATYSMNTMLPLRIFAVGSSLFFLIYGLILQLWPLLAMEMILLPINLYRLWQLVSLRKRVSEAATGGPPDFSIIRTYGRQRRLSPGSVVFHKGDAADMLYFIAEGRVRIEEADVTLKAGDIFGEIAFFTPASTRTATATCPDAAVVYELDKSRFMRLQFEDPSFGLAIMQLVTGRLIANGGMAGRTDAMVGAPSQAG